MLKDNFNKLVALIKTMLGAVVVMII